MSGRAERSVHGTYSWPQRQEWVRYNKMRDTKHNGQLMQCPQICSQRVINWFVVRDHWQICVVPFRCVFFSLSLRMGIRNCCCDFCAISFERIFFLFRFCFVFVRNFRRQELNVQTKWKIKWVYFIFTLVTFWLRMHFHCWIFFKCLSLIIVGGYCIGVYMLSAWIFFLLSFSFRIRLISLWLLKRSIRLQYTYRNCELNIIYKHTTGKRKKATTTKEPTKPQQY